MPSLKKSLLLSLAQKYSQLLITFVSGMIVARILVPEEVGIYSVVAAIVVLAHVVREFGVGSYLVQERDLTGEKLTSAMMVTLSWSYTAALLLHFGADEIAAFFGRSEVEQVVDVLKLNFLLIPFGSVPLALLRRAMRFGDLLKVHIGSTLIQAITSVTLAINGFSYMSLAWGSLAGVVATILIVSIYRPKMSYARPGKHAILDVFSFGSKSSYSQLLHSGIIMLPEILIGRYFGMASTGLFSRANGLVKLFHMGIMQGVIPVLLPHFVNTLKTTGSLQEEYFRTVRHICCIAWPFFLFMSLFAHKIILLLFGQNWVEAAPIVGWLAATAAVGTMFSTNVHVFVALKRMNEEVKNQTIAQAFSAILLITTALISFKALLVGIIISKIFSCLVSNHFISKLINAPWQQFVANLKQPALVSIFTVIPLIAVAWFQPFNSFLLFFDLLCSGLVFVIAWLAAMTVTRSELIDLLRRSKPSNSEA